MNNSIPSDIKTPSFLKKCWKVGNNTVVVIDKTLVQRLGIDEQNTLFQQELTEGGILLRVIRSGLGDEIN